MQRIAILAGGGRLPLLLAESIVSRGGRAHLVGVRGEAGPEIENFPHTWVTWGSVNAIIGALRRESDGTMMIAGTVSRPNLWRLSPDLGLIRYLPQVLKMLRGGDDAVLTRLIRFFEWQGLTVKGVGDVAPELLAGAGRFGARSRDGDSTTIERDTALGFEVLGTLADLDVGQAIAVEDGRILAIEGVEGTDRMLGRIANLADRRGPPGLLVKGPKPGQDLRVDVPTVGAQTIERLADARLGTLIIVSGKTLLLERSDMVQRAEEKGIGIVSVDHAPTQRSRAAQNITSGRVLGRLSPSVADSRDARTAAEVCARLVPFKTGRAAAVIRDHVLAVSAAEGPVAMARRVSSLRQWGRGKAARGAAAIAFDPTRDTSNDLTSMIDALENAGLAGLAVLTVKTGTAAAIPLPAEAIAAADRLGLFLVEVTDQIAPSLSGST